MKRSSSRARVVAILLSSCAVVTGCTALLGDYEVGTAPPATADGGNDATVTETGGGDAAVTDANEAGDADDGGDAGCRVTSGGVLLDDAFTVAAGQEHTCAIRQDGAVYCWGNNNFGQLGVPQATALSSNKPVKVQFPAELGNARITQIALTEATTFAIDSQLRLWAWGDNQNGLLANGATDANPHEVPAIVKTGTGAGAMPFLARQIAPHWYAACALSSTGNVFCWGKNFAGELGTTPTAPPEGTDSFVPVAAFSIVPSPQANAVLAPGIGSSATCYASGPANEGMRCWGGRFAGQLLQNLSTPPNGGVNYSAHTTLVNAGAAMPFAQVAYGTNYGAALDNAGRLFTWGTTDNAQHGAGGAPTAGTAKALAGIAFKNISAGYVFVCGVDDTKTVRCRGNNAQNQLGRSAPSVAEQQAMDPVVNGSQPLTGARSVHAGFFHACAIMEGTCGPRGPGAVKCWGQGTKGELGDDTGASSVSPVDVKAP